MIRSNKVIQGRKIRNNEYKLIQYADDTHFFLDGSDISLKQTLNVLRQFYEMSGLKLNGQGVNN